MNEGKVLIRLLEERDIQEITDAFQEIGWEKPASQYEIYLKEQAQKLRDVYVAFIEEHFAGYLTICWTSTYGPFREESIPKIVDFNVLPKNRRQGIGARLMDKAESEIAKVSSVAGIGVGLDSDYGAAQRLYVKRGYIPDGRGLHYRGHYPVYGEKITVDDSLAIYLTKKLK